MGNFIQVGVTAARDPVTGQFLSGVPLYVEETEAAQEGKITFIRDISALFAQRMKQYQEAVKSATVDKQISANG